ncbi:EpsG family protein [Sphingobacterium thalpophilum]|uniref:EpsG family protein n=1 Tax=Sphingobacterium thalpophilum TaxID=259 RepID=UPI003C73B5BD
MALYYLVFAVSYLLCIFDFIKSESIKALTFFSFCAVITMLVAFREVGIDNDSVAYQEMFGSYANATFDDIIAGGYGYVEKGYVFLNKLIAILGGNYRVLFVIMALTTALVNYMFFWRKSDFPFITLLFYISFFYLYRDFTQIRYGLSAAICMWSAYYFFKKRYLQTFVTFVVALSFHNSAVIMPLALLITQLFKNQFWYIVVPLPCIFIGKILTLSLLFSIFGHGPDHMDIYLHDDSLGSASISLVGYCICLLYYFLVHYKGANLDKDTLILRSGDYYFKLVSIAVSINFLFINISIFQRFSFILFQFAGLLISITIALMAERIRERYIFLIYYFFIATFFILYGMRMINADLIRPYNLPFYD